MFNCGECKIITKKYYISKKTNFILLEYASKGCLFDYIYEKEKISFKIGNNNWGLREDFGKLFFEKILKGITEYHNSGVSHRDLKLENILLDENLILK